MRINSSQNEIIESLSCERLSSNDANLRIVDNFECCRNESLANVLKDSAFEDDRNGDIAYYMVKTKNNDVLFYFSLKCGLLYDNFTSKEQYEKISRLVKVLREMHDSESTSDDDKKLIGLILENFKGGKGISKSDIDKIECKDNRVIRDIDKEFNNGINQVGRTFSGIEIVQFCANSNRRDVWKSYSIDQKIGVVVFWTKIVPKVFDAMKIVGCKYLFLFASDDSVDETLINYYKDNMKLEVSDDRNTMIPLYDIGCKFMYLETKFLKKYQKEFYDNFNRDEEAV